MKSRSYRTARFGALLCLCLALSALEGWLLPLVPIPLPGIKLGLSNLVLLFCIGMGSYPSAWTILIARSIFTALLFGNPATFLFSALGGVFSLLSMQLCAGLLKHGFSFFTLSVIGSVCFQFGQSLAALILYGQAIRYYLPLLLVAGAFTGALLGFVQNLLFRRLRHFLSLLE